LLAYGYLMRWHSFQNHQELLSKISVLTRLICVPTQKAPKRRSRRTCCHRDSGESYTLSTSGDGLRPLCEPFENGGAACGNGTDYDFFLGVVGLSAAASFVSRVLDWVLSSCRELDACDSAEWGVCFWFSSVPSLFAKACNNDSILS
jgi:hypothetical protein